MTATIAVPVDVVELETVPAAATSPASGRVAWLTAVACTTAFATMHLTLLRLADRLDGASFGAPPMAGGLWRVSMARFAVVAGATLVGAARGRRWTFAAVGIAVAGSALLGPGIGPAGDAVPATVGAGWALRSAPTALPWFGAAVDLLLALAPAAVLAWSRPRRAGPEAAPLITAAALGLVGVIALLVAWHQAVTAPEGWAMRDAVARLLPAATLGAVVAGRRIRWAVPAAVAAVVLTDHLFAMWVYGGSGSWLPTADDLAVVGPAAAVAAVVACWPAVAAGLTSVRRSPTALLVAVNALNVADAVLTAIAVRAGTAIEANPVVRWLGLPAKVVLVGVATVWLAKRRPAALVWPLAALAAVLAYHLAGLAVS